MSIDARRLALLVSLSGLGTVRAVAAEANLSPSTVSQQLGVLEAEVGSELLVRAGRRVELTDAGRLLAERGRDLLDHLDSIESELADLRLQPSGHVRIAAFPSAMRSIVIPAVQRLAQQHPGITVEVVEREPHESLPALRRGDVDIALTADFRDGAEPLADDVSSTALLTDELVLVTSSGTAAGVPARLAEFAHARWALDVPGSYLGELVPRLCRQAGFEPLLSGRFSSFDVLLRHVESGLSVALLPELAVDRRYDVVAHALRPRVRRRIALAVRKAPHQRLAVALASAELERAASA